MKIIKDVFHHLMIMAMKEREQIKKVQEECWELESALKTGDRDLILEELADVVNVFPYLEIIFNIKINKYLLWPNTEGWNYTSILRCLTVALKHSQNNSFLFRNTVRDMARAYLYRLYEVAKQYEITDEEIQICITMKRERCKLALKNGNKESLKAKSITL